MSEKTLQKNVIVIKTDEQRFDTLGCLGSPVVQTPNLDRLAAQGVVMENTFCVSPLCVPSRVAFFTGQRPHRSGAVNNSMASHIQAGQWTFLEPLKEQGYAVGLAGKNHAFHDDYFEQWFDCREEYGHWGKCHGNITDTDQKVSNWLRDEKRPGFENARMLMEGLIEEPMPFPREECPTWRIADDAIAFVQDNRESPFFLHCSFPDPHWPNVVCEPYYSMYDPKTIELDGMDIDWSTHPFAHYVQSQSSGFDAYTDLERKKVLATYSAQVTFIDDAVGRLLDALEELGLRERTLIVFTSDHGDLAGRFGLISKTKAFYEPILRIPLLLAGPGLPQGKRFKAEVSNIDVMPTLFEHMGLSIPSHVQGESFLSTLRGETDEHRNEIFAEVGSYDAPPPPIPMDEYPAYNKKREKEDGIFWFTEYTTKGRSAMVRKDGWKYCFYTGDMEELYDLNLDPLELENRANDPACASRKSDLKNRLMEWLLNAGD